MLLAKPSISSKVAGDNGILGLVSASHAVTHIFTALLPLIIPVAMKEFGFNYSQLGLLIGASSIVSGVMQLTFGYVGRFALRKTLLAAQNVAMALCMGIMALATGFLPFLGANLGMRIATSPQHPVGNSLVADVFGKRLRGSAFAVNFAGGNVGAVIVPMLGTFLILNVGWRWTTVIFALPALVLAVMLVTLIKEEKSPMASGERATVNPLREAIQILSSRTMLIIFLTSVIAAGGRGMGVIMMYVPLYLRNGLNLDQTYVGVLYTLLMIGSILGPLAAGRLSDRHGRRGILIGGYMLSMASTSALVALPGQSALIPLIILIVGCASYAESPVMQTFIADASLYGSRDLAFGLFFAVGAVAGSLWASLLGYLVDSHGFVFAFHVMAASYIAGALLLLFAREQEN